MSSRQHQSFVPEVHRKRPSVCFRGALQHTPASRLRILGTGGVQETDNKRLFHHPRLYKHIHKTHHEWTAPVGITSVYCHPLEHYMVNLTPGSIGPVIMGSHLSIVLLWFTLIILSTTVSHSGYHFPFLPSPEAHDFHHAKFNQNFGTMGVLDRLHGTDELFRRSKAYERHILMLSIMPVKELFPDTPKGKACCK